MRARERWIVVLLLAFAAAVRALRFWGVMTWAHWDEANVAVPAVQILDGTFPVHHVGVEYVGATAAYPLAAWFAVAGHSPLALDLFCYAVSFGVAWTGFLVARRLLPAGPAVFALAVLAVPTLLLAHWGIHGALNPLVMLLLGNLILLGTHTAFFRRPREAAPLLALGLLAGIGWWAYPLIVVYWAPFAVLALRTGLIWRPRFWLLPVGVALGGLPDWIYEILNYPTARLMLSGSGSLPPESLGFRASLLGGDLALQLIGGSAADNFVPAIGLQATLAGLAALALARAAVRDRAGIRWLAGAGGQPGEGLATLWTLVALNVGLMLFTKRTLGPTYILPLYSVLPIWFGECFWWLGRQRRGLGAGALAGWLVIQLWANWTATLGRDRDTPRRWSGLLELAAPLTDWLTARGIDRVYWAVGGRIVPYEYTYLTGMRVIAADLWAETVVQHAHAVDAAAAPPIITTANRLAELRESLRGLSLAVRETPVGDFVVVEPRPTGSMRFTALPVAGWTVTTSHRLQDAPNLVDRDAGTGWSVGNRQAPGQWLAVDLGREQTVARIDLLAIDWQEVPAGFHVEWSRDGVRWATAVSVSQYWGPLFWSERHAFLKVRRGRVQAIFDPVRARYLRVVMARSGPQAWAARELFVYEPGPAREAVRESGELAAALRAEGVSFVYANPWLSARVRVESRESIGTLESNSAVNSYGRSEPEPSVLERFRPRPDRAVLLDDEADVAEVRGVLTERGLLARERVVGPYRLLVLGAAAPARPLATRGWRASASVGGATAARAVDGDGRTRWTAPGPVDSTTSFTVELDRPRRVTGLEVTPGSREGGPSDYAVEGSSDGRAWAPLAPTTWAGPLFWSGTELLRNSRPEWAVGFPSTTLRALRIRPAGPAPTWSIAEIRLFE
jgi:F5/8 type C domain